MKPIDTTSIFIGRGKESGYVLFSYKHKLDVDNMFKNYHDKVYIKTNNKRQFFQEAVAALREILKNGELDD
uniref:DUF5659 domain-containing protein n=1 Tax=viral metagenome TaxID=1070528 RepID=A0A6M3LII8_9ZZZZ